MEQTLAEKLRILADAAEAGETEVMVDCDRQPIAVAASWLDVEIYRIPPKPATIKIGNREINAPLRVMPKIGTEYWYVGEEGNIRSLIWWADKSDNELFNNANCWATKEDAEAYRDASLAVRMGEV